MFSTYLNKTLKCCVSQSTFIVRHACLFCKRFLNLLKNFLQKSKKNLKQKLVESEYFGFCFPYCLTIIAKFSFIKKDWTLVHVPIYF